MLAAEGIYAMFRVTRPDGTTHWDRRALVYWNDDGDGVILYDTRLRVADGLPGFTGYEDGRVGGLVLAHATVAVLDDGSRVPVVAWTIDTDGWGTPHLLLDDGISGGPDNVVHYEHPGFTEAATP